MSLKCRSLADYPGLLIFSWSVCHFFQLSMGWGLEKKLNKLLIISTIILYIATTTESISNNIVNKCLHSSLICFYSIFNLNQF